MKKYVKADYKGKKNAKKIIDSAKSGKITAYAKHDGTGAIIPIDPEFIQKMQNGESYSLEEAEKRYDRFMFKLPELALRWGLDNKETLGVLIGFSVPCFVNPRELDKKNDSALIGSEDVCVFFEYVEAIENNHGIQKKNDIEPIFETDFF